MSTVQKMESTYRCTAGTTRKNSRYTVIIALSTLTVALIIFHRRKVIQNFLHLVENLCNRLPDTGNVAYRRKRITNLNPAEDTLLSIIGDRTKEKINTHNKTITRKMKGGMSNMLFHTFFFHIFLFLFHQSQHLFDEGVDICFCKSDALSSFRVQILRYAKNARCVIGKPDHQGTAVPDNLRYSLTEHLFCRG